MSQKTEFVISARDDTRQAFESVNAGLTRLTGANVNLAGSFRNVALAASGLAGVTSLAVLKGKVDDAISSMAGLKEASEATGASVENLGALKGVAKIGGRDFEVIQASIIKLNKALHGTDDESKGAGKALADLGLNITKLRGLDPAQAFLEIALAQEKFADGGGKSAAIMAIMGKNAATLIPYMHDLADEQQRSGKVTAAQAAAADAYEKNVKRLQASFGALSREIAAAAVGPLKDITDWMVKGKKEGGLLQGVLVGIGAAVAKAFGGEINPTKILEQDVSAAFTRVADLRKRIAATQTDLDAGNFGLLGEKFGRNRLESLKAELTSAERRLARLTEKNRARAAAEVEADKPKDRSLDAKTYGVGASERTQPDAATALLQRLDEQIAVKAMDLQATGKLTEAEREYAKVLQQLDSGALKATARQRELIVGKLDFLKAADAELANQEKYRQALEAQSKAMDEYLPKLQEEAERLENAATLYGLDEAQIAFVTQRRLEEAVAIAEANGALPEHIAFLEKELDIRRRITQARESIKDQKALEETKNEFDLFAQNAARSMQDAFADFLFDPFAKGADGMAKRFGQTIQRMIADAVSADLMRKLFGGLAKGGEGEGLLGGAFSWLGSVFGNANGGVYAGAGIGAYSGTIVSQPTIFPFAKGIGLMGEAGPEAILPLKRGADGKLGVQSGSTGHTINVYVTGTNAPDVRRAAGQGAREALAALNGARRYG